MKSKSGAAIYQTLVSIPGSDAWPDRVAIVDTFVS
jgi:hypothetical protein